MNVREWLPLNLELMSNPYNWVVVALMVLMAGLALGLIFHPANAETGDDPNAS
jgi:hypothetical protein